VSTAPKNVGKGKKWGSLTCELRLVSQLILIGVSESTWGSGRCQVSSNIATISTEKQTTNNNTPLVLN
jgi:hypothetical protein